MAIACGTASTAQQHTDLERMNLRDSVEFIREIIYSTSGSSSNGSGRLISSDKYLSFRPDGNITETLVYEKGRLFSVLRYEYDEEGRKTGYREYDAQDRLYLTVDYKHEDGLVKEERIDRSLQKMFDDKRREIDVEYHKYYQNLYTRIVYDHNFSGKITGATYYNPDSTLDFRYEYAYNYKGHRVTSSYYNSDNKLSWKEKYTNDLTGNPIQIQRFENNRLVSTTIVEYELDKSGNWISRIESVETLPNVFGEKPEANSTVTIREIGYF